jgi:hypothetical protein
MGLSYRRVKVLSLKIKFKLSLRRKNQIVETKLKGLSCKENKGAQEWMK